MTFVELINALRIECDAAGADITSVSGLGKENARLKNWINLAWREIQMLHDGRWNFMLANFTVALTDNVWEYNPTAAPFSLANFRVIKRETMRVYATATGYGDEQELPFIPYDIFKRQYRYGSSRTDKGRPSVFSVDEKRNIVFGLVPTAGWTVEGQYFRRPTDLVANGDSPDMPVEYHMAIVYRAMLKDGEFEWTNEQKARAVREYRRAITSMEIEQLPQVSMSLTLG